MVENLPANAGDTVSVPGPGRFHAPPQGNEAGVPQPLKPVCLEPTLGDRSHIKEKPSRRN